MIKAALFDLDGVIIDTEPTYSRFWSHMGSKYNAGVDNFADVIKGTTLTQILDKYFPDDDTKQKIIGELVDFENNMSYDVFPGVVPCLRRLKKAGIPCAIVTSSNLEKMSHLWHQQPELKQYFDVVITDEDVTRSKPDPQPYIIASEKLGIAPEDTCVFEDSYNGLLSGRRAGAKVVALDTTNPRDNLTDKADMVISSLDEFSCDML